MWGFFRRFIGEKLAVASTCCFAAALATFLGLPSCHYAFSDWIDALEPWIAICVLGAGWLFDLYLASKRISWLLLSLVVFVIGIGIKEMAYITPIFLIWILFARRRFKDKWMSTLPFFVTAVLFFAFRTALFHGRGAYYGSNGSWIYRLLISMFGGKAVPLFGNYNIDSLIIIGALSAIFAWAHLFSDRSKAAFYKAILLTTVAACLLLLSSDLNEIPPFVTVARFLTVDLRHAIANQYIPALIVFILLVVWREMITGWNRKYALGYSFAALMYLPLLTAPITEHALYLSAMGWSIVLTTAALSWIKKVDIRVK
jgi:hypothetical protein